MTSPRDGSKYASHACEPCRMRKKKCDKACPACTTCKKKLMKCIYEDTTQGDVRKLRAQVATLTSFIKGKYTYLLAHSYLGDDPRIQYPISSGKGDEDSQSLATECYEITSQNSQKMTLHPPLKSEREHIFSSLPIELSPRERILIDHFLSSIAPLDFQLDLSADFSHIKHLSLASSITSSLALHVILAMAAADIDALHGREISREALIHHGIALRGVNKALVDQHKVPEMIDECIVAVTLLAAQGIISGDPKAFNTHMKGVALMVKARGGLEMLRKTNSQLFALISCFEYAGVCALLSGRRIIPQTPASPVSPHLSLLSPPSLLSSALSTPLTMDHDGVPSAILSSLPARFDLRQFIVSTLYTLLPLAQHPRTNSSMSAPSQSQDPLPTSIAVVAAAVDSELYHSLCVSEEQARYSRPQYIIQVFQILVLHYCAILTCVEPSSPLSIYQVFRDQFETSMDSQSANYSSWATAVITLFKSLVDSGSPELLGKAIDDIVHKSVVFSQEEWKNIRQRLLDLYLTSKICEGRTQDLWKTRFMKI